MQLCRRACRQLCRRAVQAGPGPCAHLPGELGGHLLVLCDGALGGGVELVVGHLEEVGLGLAQLEQHLLLQPVLLLHVLPLQVAHVRRVLLGAVLEQPAGGGQADVLDGPGLGRRPDAGDDGHLVREPPRHHQSTTVPSGITALRVCSTSCSKG